MTSFERACIIKDIADISSVAAAITETVHDTMVFVPSNVRNACEEVMKTTLNL